ncbi:MAG: DUF5615 family PIN-like protein [Clostridiales Family XIII bacterium]|nr:DUF5615 family PIN-like protein [Clostridiales Family XIII bacterium]
MKVLVDMNLPPRLAVLLAEFGIAATHWSSVGAANAKDIELFQYARRNGLVILTADIDFSVLLVYTKSSKPSVAQLRLQELSLDHDVPLIYAALSQNEDALMSGAIMTIDLKKTRLRLLPLR